MVGRYELTDAQWAQIKDFLPGKVSDPGRSASDNRLFINAVIWIARTGSAWRNLPERYGKWSNVHKRFMRWSVKGVWQAMFNTLAVSEETEWLMLDSAIVRAHQHASGAKRGSKRKR